LTLFSLLSMLRKFSFFPFFCVCYHILLPTFPLYNSAYIISLQASKIKHISFLVVFLLNKCIHSCPIFAYFCRSEHLANVLALKDLLRQQVLFQCNSSILCFANLLFLFTDVVLLFPWFFFSNLLHKFYSLSNNLFLLITSFPTNVILLCTTAEHY